MSFLRAIEKGIRRSTLKLLSGSGRIGPNDSLPAPFPERPRILLIRIDRIGDAIISTPALRILRERFPEGRIDLLHSEKNRAVIPFLPFTDNVYMLPRKTFGMAATIRRLRKNRYDAVVNLHLNRSASASLASRLVRAAVVIESSRENAFAGAAETGNHVVTMTAGLLKPFGVAPITPENEGSHPLELRLPHDSSLRAQQLLTQLSEESKAKESRQVLINISTTHPSRNWPTEHFTATAHLLREAAIIPIICGTPGDAERVREIGTQSGARVLPPQSNYADFAAAVARVDGVITPDTSTVHLAAALGRPTVALYASAQAARAWPPWSVPHITLLATEGMEKISPETVAAAMRELIQGERHTAQGANSGTNRQTHY